MKHRNTIFNQLLTFLPRNQFQKIVNKHKGDYRSRKLSTWNQLIIMLFSQISKRQSLRDLTDSFNSLSGQHYHLGVKEVYRSSLSDANKKRPVKIFQETFFLLLEKVQYQLPNKDVSQMVRLIDSTTIDLNLNQFKWAGFRKTKAGIKLHTVYDPNAHIPVYFAMTEAKTNDIKGLNNLPMEFRGNLCSRPCLQRW